MNAINYLIRKYISDSVFIIIDFLICEKLKENHIKCTNEVFGHHEPPEQFQCALSLIIQFTGTVLKRLALLFQNVLLHITPK